MSLPLTLIILALVIALGALSAWRGARAPDLIRGPRLVPWRFLMIVAAAVTIPLLFHLVKLLTA